MAGAAPGPRDGERQLRNPNDVGLGRSAPRRTPPTEEAAKRGGRRMSPLFLFSIYSILFAFMFSRTSFMKEEPWFVEGGRWGKRPEYVARTFQKLEGMGVEKGPEGGIFERGVPCPAARHPCTEASTLSYCAPLPACPRMVACHMLHAAAATHHTTRTMWSPHTTRNGWLVCC